MYLDMNEARQSHLKQVLWPKSVKWYPWPHVAGGFCIVENHQAEFTSQVQVHKVRGVAQSYDSAMTALTLPRL